MVLSVFVGRVLVFLFLGVNRCGVISVLYGFRGV